MTATTRSRPRLVGDGPPTCSTSLELARLPECCHDVNRYYTDLGVDWRATRTQIREAYQRSPQDARLTFVVKQLLDPAVRRAYDMTPLGCVFYDRYVDAEFRRTLVLRFGAGARHIITTQNTPTPRVLDTDPTEVHSPSSTTRITATAPAWSYSYYLWDTDQEDLPRLREWQELLVSKLGRNKQHLQLAVGLAGGTEHPVTVTVLGFRVVAFLRDDEGPTDALAMRAASELTACTR